MDNQLESDIGYCRALAAGRDHGAYVASLMARMPDRRDLWPLLALRCRLSDIAGTVSEPTLGHIRLTWWRAALQCLGTREEGEPILRALRVVAARHSIGHAAFEPFVNSFEPVIDGEAPDADDAPFLSLAAQIAGQSSARFEAAYRAARAMEAQYRGTRWHGNPPFLALRLWFSTIGGRRERPPKSG